MTEGAPERRENRARAGMAARGAGAQAQGPRAGSPKQAGISTSAAAPSNRGALARVLGWARADRGRLALAILLSAGAAIASVALMATSGSLISHAALMPPLLDLMIAITLVRALGIARGVLRYLERVVGHDAILRVSARLRARVVARLERIVPEGLDEFHRGELLTRMVDDVERVQSLYLRALVPPVVAAGGALFAAGLIAVYSASAALVLLGGLAGVGVGASVLAMRLGRCLGSELSAARARVRAGADDLLRGLGELVIYGRWEDRLAELERADRALEALERDQAARAGLSSAVAVAGAGVATAIVAAVAIAALRADAIAGVELALVVLAAFAAFEVVWGLPPAAVHLSDGLASARRVSAIAEGERGGENERERERGSSRPGRERDMDAEVDTRAAAPPAAASISSKEAIEGGSGGYLRTTPERGQSLHLRGAHLRYRPEHPPALAGVDFELRRGERVALIGPSGAGKSTVAQVLAALRRLDEGRAYLGDDPYDAIGGDEVRRYVGLVEQEPALFATSLRENLRLARPGAGDDELAWALARVRLDAWAEKLPRGLATEIGDDGARLSGGQRRRLALARMLLRDPPLLVFDEPTGDLDPITAAELRRELLGAASGRGVVVITHDLPRPDEIDRVVALRRGAVIYDGSPEMLPVELGGAQARGFSPVPG